MLGHFFRFFFLNSFQKFKTVNIVQIELTNHN